MKILLLIGSCADDQMIDGNGSNYMIKYIWNDCMIMYERTWNDIAKYICLYVCVWIYVYEYM